MARNQEKARAWRALPEVRSRERASAARYRSKNAHKNVCTCGALKKKSAIRCRSCWVQKRKPTLSAKVLHQQYYLKNRQKLLTRSKIYYEAVKHTSEFKKKSLVWTKAWQAANHAKVLEGYRKYYWKNRDKCREKWKRYYRKNVEALLERSARWRVSEAGRKSREASRENANAYARRRYHEDSTRREYLKEWSKRSPKRRLIKIKWEKCGQLCYICGLNLYESEITIDHVIPSIYGGENKIENFMPAHGRCNSRKNKNLSYPVARPDLLEAV